MLAQNIQVKKRKFEKKCNADCLSVSCSSNDILQNSNLVSYLIVFQIYLSCSAGGIIYWAIKDIYELKI